MIRTVLTDAQWDKIAPHCLGKVTDAGCSGKDNRLFVEAVLWKVCTDSPWRDLHEELGRQTPFSSASTIGRSAACSNAYSRRSRTTRTWSTR